MPHMKNSTKKTKTGAPQNSTARQCIIIEHLTEQYQRNDSITVRIVVRRMRKKTARICSTILCSTEIGAESRREMPASTVMNTYKSVCVCVCVCYLLPFTIVAALFVCGNNNSYTYTACAVTIQQLYVFTIK